jgi:hypothetical protein
MLRTPYENNFLVGPILLYMLFVSEISTISPVFVPRYAYVSVGSITQQVYTLLI